MAEYIDRGLFAREVNRLSTNPFNEWDTMGILLLLDTIPSADVQPVVHGHWIEVDEQPYFRKHFHTRVCSVCRKKKDGNWSYCPSCGARMVNDDEHTD